MAPHEPVSYRELQASALTGPCAVPVPGTTALTSESAHPHPAQVSAGSRLHRPTRTDWRLVLGLTRRDTVLVLGRDSLELGRHLAPWVRQVYSAVDSARSGSDSTADGGPDPLVIQHELASLPLTAGSLDWIIFDGPMPEAGDFLVTLARVLPTLKPGGGVFVTFHNQWGLGGRLGAQQRSRSADPDGVACRGLRHALQLMASAGCSELACYAVLPNRRAARTMIPLEPPCPPAAEKFALDQAWKRATPGRALGRLALHLCIDLHVLRHLYPHYFVVGRKSC